VTLDYFLSLKLELDLISETKWVRCLYHFNCAYLRSFTHSYIYLAQERTLIVMVNSDAHEIVVTTFAIYLIRLWLRRTVQTFSHRRLAATYKRSVWYGDHQGDHYTADMTLFFHYLLYPLRFSTSKLPSLRVWTPSVARSTTCSSTPTPGRVVVRIKENSNSSWSKPKKTPNRSDFVSVDDFGGKRAVHKLLTSMALYG